jgi:hypothetical protein
VVYAILLRGLYFYKRKEVKVSYHSLEKWFRKKEMKKGKGILVFI